MKPASLLSFFTYLLLPGVFSAQNYAVSRPVGEALTREVTDFSKQLFEPKFDLEFSFSSYDLYSTLDSVPRNINYSESYRLEQEELLKLHPYNPIIWNNLGNYYRSQNNGDDAVSSYLKAFQYLDSGYSRTSATYYSIRGSLKMNLEMDGAQEDLERAIEMDANDSVAVYLLPMSLLNSGQYEKGKSFCEAQLARSFGERQAVWFMYYSMSDLMSQMGELIASSERLEKLKKTDYSEVIDMGRIDTLYSRYRANPKIVSIRSMLDVFPLMIKMVALMDGKKSFDVAYTKHEKQRISELRNEFGVNGMPRINEYSRLKTMAFIDLLEGNVEESRKKFLQALEIFPADKESDNFSRTLCYNALLAIYSIEEEGEKEIALLEKVTSASAVQKIDPTWRANLAKCYLQAGDIPAFRKASARAYEASKSDYEALRLMGHVAFMDNQSGKIDYYMNKAGEHISEAQYVELCQQFALYFVAYGNGSKAYEFTENARKIDPGSPCSICDEIEKKFLKAEKKQ